MNNYGFDYFNYIANVPSNINYSKMNPNMYPNGYMMNDANFMKEQEYYMNNNLQLYDPLSGFLKGNLFKNLYDSYKKYKPQDLNPSNEKEAMLWQVMQYKFLLVELGLYLDTHPNDKEVLSLYRNYLNIEKQSCREYEKKYGPLTCDSEYIGNNSWAWDNSPWPWEVK